MVSSLERVVVVGTSGCGKTTFSRRLAEALSFRCLELDSFFWLPGWEPRDQAEFRERVAQQVAAGEQWVIDGNYGSLRDLIWPRATDIIWLNYAYVRVVWQVTRRSVTHILQRREVFPGCPETFQNVFLNRDSIIWWSISTYHRRRRKYEVLSQGKEFPHVRWVELSNPQAANRFLESFNARAKRVADKAPNDTARS